MTWKREDGDSILMRKPGSREMQRGKPKIFFLSFENCFFNRVNVGVDIKKIKKKFGKSFPKKNVLVITQCILKMVRSVSSF